MVSAVHTINISNWTEHGTSVRWDLVSLVLAIMLHVPLIFMRLDAHRKIVDRSTSHLVAIDLIEPELPKPVVVEAPPVAPKESGFMAKLKALVKREPPPPPPVVAKKPLPEKLAEAPKPIDIQAKLNLPEKLAPKLETKSGFKTTLDAKLIQDKKLAMNAAPVGIAPLSASKLGTVQDRASLKSGKSKFQVAANEKLSGIGEGAGGLAAPETPAIAIRTGSRGTTEKFTAPAPQMANKGRIGAVSSAGLDAGPNLGLRDSIIARDAAPTAIGNAGGRVGGTSGGVPGGVPGGLGSKKDAGRFQGNVGSVGGVGSGIGSNVNSGPVIAPLTPIKKRDRPSLFVITGPLKDRPLEKQSRPDYPAWAESQGIEASIVLEITVDANGFIKNVVVRRTSGYPKWDDSTIRTLNQWKFASLPGTENREEVGLITFNFSLK